MRGWLRRTASKFRREEGSMALEMALSASILLATLFGICQMSIALYVYQVTSAGAREGARYAMVRGNTSCTNTPSLTNCNASTDQIQTFVRSRSFSRVHVTTTWCAANSSTPRTWATCSSGTSNAPGNLVKVYVYYPMSFTIPFASTPQSFTVGSTSEMVISQ